MKARLRQRLGEEIGELFAGGNVMNVDRLVSNKTTGEVHIDLDTFRSRVKNMISR